MTPEEYDPEDARIVEYLKNRYGGGFFCTDPVEAEFYGLPYHPYDIEVEGGPACDVSGEENNDDT